MFVAAAPLAVALAVAAPSAELAHKANDLRRANARLEQQLDAVETAVLGKKYEAGLDLPVAAMPAGETVVRQAGFRPTTAPPDGAESPADAVVRLEGENARLRARLRARAAELHRLLDRPADR